MGAEWALCNLNALDGERSNRPGANSTGSAILYNPECIEPPVIEYSLFKRRDDIEGEEDDDDPDEEGDAGGGAFL